MNTKTKPTGFSLIEMLVVLAIMGILITVGVSNLWRGREKAAFDLDYDTLYGAIQETRSFSVSMRDHAEKPPGDSLEYNNEFLGYGVHLLMFLRLVP